MNIKLLVLRAKDEKAVADFYTLLGATFDYHKHGKSPYHFSATVGQTVLEIYPLAKSQTDPDSSLRLGFEVDAFDQVIQALANRQVPFVSQPFQTEFGFMAVVTDPDGRKVEIYKR